MDKNDIEKKSETAIATTRRGHEDRIDQSDLMIPRTMLIQFTPPKNLEIDPAVHTPGKIVNSITGEVLPVNKDGNIEFIPIRRGVLWIRFNPQDKDKPNFDPQFEPGATIWKSSDPSDPRVAAEGAWGEDGTPPLATKYINYLAFVPGHDMPIVISFGKTSFKAGKALSTMTQFAPGDLFSWKYKLRSRMEQNDQKQKYYVLVVEKAGKCSTEEFNAAEGIYEIYSGKELKIHEDGAADENEQATPKQPWE